MVRKYFGTDGIRGKANEGAMTAETALRVGMAAGRVFRRGDHRHRVVIGKDTRLSGYMLGSQRDRYNRCFSCPRGNRGDGRWVYFR